MYYFLFILLLFLSFLESFFKYFKVKNAVFLVAAILFFLIQAFNTWSPDIESYATHYRLIHKDYVRSASEPIHIFLIEKSQLLGLTFSDFYILYGVLILVPFLIFIKKSTPYPVFALTIFFIIPFFPDIAQIRNFLAVALFFFGLLFYERNRLVFYIFFVLAVLSHYSMISIVVFFIIKDMPFFKNAKTSNIIILVGVLLLNLIPKEITNPLVTSINPKYSSYLAATSTYLGSIALFLPFFALNNFVINHYRNHYPGIQHKIEEKYKRNIPIFIRFIQYANYLIILQYFIRDFSRITMNLSILSYLYLSIVVFYGWKAKKTNASILMVKSGLLIWGFATFYITFLMLNGGEYMEIIEKTFSSNSIFGK